MIFNPVFLGAEGSPDWIEETIPAVPSGKMNNYYLEIPFEQVQKSVVVYTPDSVVFGLVLKDGTNYTASSAADRSLIVSVDETTITFNFSAMFGPSELIVRYLIV